MGPERRLARSAAFCLSAAWLCACGHIGFGRTLSPGEVSLQAEVRRYYTEVAAAFATGDAEVLAGLFSPAISKPMNLEQIKAWASGFFAKNGRAHFRVLKIEFDKLGYAHAVVTLRFQVEPVSGVGGFTSSQVDTLERRRGRWRVSSWEDAPPPGGACPDGKR